MSKLIDRLNRAASAPQPMGFRASHGAPSRPGIHVVAAVTAITPDLAEQVSGADAAVLKEKSVKAAASALKAASRSAPDVPWGFWPDSVAGDDAESITGAGGDFAVMGSSVTAVLVSPEEDTGVILQIDPSISESLVRAINDLPVDAAMIVPDAQWQHPLTWQQLMLLHRLASLVGKPLLLQIPAGAASEELRLIWEAGIEAVVVTAGSGEVSRLRNVITGLEAPSHRRRSKLDATLPTTGRDADALIETDEEDDY